MRPQLQEVVQRRAPIYDKSQDGHYNLISALHKSVRGSDPDAALYYLCRMLDAGEDPLYLARRVVRMAVEDIGLADPQALVICNAAKDAYDFLGSPEGELAIAQAVIYVATAPKSNAAYMAYGAAMRVAKEARLAAAAEAHPQCADQADEAKRATARATTTTTTRRTRFRGRTIFPKRSAGRNSTTRPSAASSARSGSGWSIGRRCGRSGVRESNCCSCARDHERGVLRVRRRAAIRPLGRRCATLQRQRRQPPRGTADCHADLAALGRRVLHHRQDVQGGPRALHRGPLLTAA